MFSSPLQRQRGGNRARDPKDGYAEDFFRKSKSSDDELPDRADRCESEEDSDAEVDQKVRETAGSKRELRSLKKQVEKGKDPSGSIERQRDTNKSVNKSKAATQQTTPTRQSTRQVFGMFGSSAGKTGAQRRGRIEEDESPSRRTADHLQGLIGSAAQEDDLDAAAPENTTTPLGNFLKGKLQSAEQAQPGEEAESSPDPIAEPVDSVRESIGSANQSKAKTKSRGRHNSMARPASRSLLKQQLKDQDKEKMDLRRSSRNPGASGPFYGRIASTNASINKKASGHAKKTSGKVKEPEDFSVWTDWSEKYDAGKVLVDLRGIDPKQYARY
ncbi:unnamed protein product [Zymoseptoria tritici ST99CH_1E4]|uniref:Uncharacterized protein n=1 Tax=Zymoseptoria tritici ST99CH_1E4 TaxID=1276532 RepID=A0A2H1FN43_ZYMTR|nr:unnamed protein product [Zymoseptoria tritici ST99CH_1E4]